jgi:hypothetical protein
MDTLLNLIKEEKTEQDMKIPYKTMKGVFNAALL